METYKGAYLEYAGKPSYQQAQGLARKRHSVCGSVPAPDSAGMRTDRIAELRYQTRKRTECGQLQCREMRELTGMGSLLRHSEAAPPPQAQKKSQVRYCGVQREDQRQHFQTRWRPVDGKMAFCTGRRDGSAAVECDYDYLDRDYTYHTWKRMGDHQRHMGSHLQFDRFLTVEESADRSDRLPDVKNRNPPVANADGPFEKPRPHGGNLDRTCVPREDAQRRDDGKGLARAQPPMERSHLQLSTLENKTGVETGDLRNGLKRMPQKDHVFECMRPPDGIEEC
ncbi:hypothetical protein Efla_006632 [Eimeria flavescens]